MAFTPGPKPYPFISTFLFKRKVNPVHNVPYLIYVATFNNFLYQIYLHDFNKDIGIFSVPIEVACLLPPFPEEYHYGKTNFEYVDFSGRELKKGEEIEITMHFQDIVEDNNAINTLL